MTVAFLFFSPSFFKMVLKKSVEKLKHIERISRQTRHHRTHLNQVYDQKLRQEVNNLSIDYEKTLKRTKTHQQLEEQRKKGLGITIQQIANERQRYSLPKTPTQIKILPKDNKTISCHLFSNNCQLYPCQPIYHYTSFIRKEHDRTLRQRNSLNKNSTSSNHENLFLNNQEKNSQHHLAIRHVYMKRTMLLLDEQSRLLHERLTDKKSFGYVKEHQHKLKKAIQRHLEISAKFCG